MNRDGENNVCAKSNLDKIFAFVLQGGREQVMNAVIIRDSRPAWMRKEDKELVCMIHCNFYLNCNSRVGKDCKKLGGGVIPVVR